MKFQRSHIRYEPREVSTRRLAAAKRKLARQADALLYRAWGSWPVICAEFGLIWEPVRRRGKQRV